MKHLAKILCLGAAFAAPLAYATPISGSIGFGGNGTYSTTSGQFTPGGNVQGINGNAYNAYVNTAPNSGTMTGFTFDNPATFFAFNTGTIGAGENVFTTTEGGVTLSFLLTGFTSSDVGVSGPEFSGTGILSETGYTNTAANFSLSTNAGAKTFITFNTAAMTAATPEPSSLVLLGSGLVSAAGMLLRRRRTV